MSCPGVDTASVIMLAISIFRKFQLSRHFSPPKGHEATCHGHEPETNTVSSRMTLVLFRRRALGEMSGAEHEDGARVRKSRQKEAAGAADAGPMQIEWSEGEGLKLAESARKQRRRSGSVWERGSMVENGVTESGKQGWGQEQGGRGRSAVNRAKFWSCGRGVSCGSSDQLRWRTELDLSSGKSFDDRHRSATLGAAPKRVRFLSGGSFWFGLG